MLEARGDMWRAQCAAFVITTNPIINREGLAVMGRGCAKQAADFDPHLRRDFARLLREHGNVPLLLRQRPGKPALLSMPVKHHWQQPADYELIHDSCHRLVELVDSLGLASIAMPRPGCGNGGLDWRMVRPTCAEVLDDRFTVFTY